MTRGPSLDPADKRLAVEVEDHPLDYGDFEGTIPKGQYGGGTVMLWDRGFWEPEGDADKMLAKGDLKFMLDGEKLQGGWVLVRMRNDKYGKSKRNNWLLIKHHDKYAKDGDGEAILKKDHSVASGRAMKAIAAGTGNKPKPFMRAKAFQGRCGVAIAQKPERSTARRRARSRKPKPVQGKKISILPPFVEPQLCRLVEQPPSGAGWVHEVKFDGYRMQLRVEDGKAVLRTRKGLDWTDKFAAIAKAAAKLARLHPRRRNLRPGSQWRAGFRGAAGGAVGRQDRRADLLRLRSAVRGGEDLRALPLLDPQGAAGRAADKGARRRNLRYVEHFASGGDAVLQSACRMHLEGIVSKRADAPYRSGRGDDWTKSKCRAGHEVVIGGWSDHQREIPLPAGGRASRRSSDLCRPGRHRLFRRQGRSS